MASLSKWSIAVLKDCNFLSRTQSVDQTPTGQWNTNGGGRGHGGLLVDPSHVDEMTELVTAPHLAEAEALTGSFFELQRTE